MSSLVLSISHHQQLLCEYLVPDKYHGSGCIVLINSVDVAKVSLDSKTQCGSYEVSLHDREEEPEAFNQLQTDHPGPHASTELLTGGQKSENSGTIVCPDEDTREFTEADFESSTKSDTNTVLSVEVYPVIPGYDLNGVIGKGGMGIVWRAHQISTNRQVAVKTILPSVLTRPRSRVRFQREVELAAKLNHPGIATVYDSGVAQGQHYYSMEFIDGEPWSQYVRRQKPGREVILGQLLQVLDAIANAHEHGVIHRDLKPSNILIDRAGNAIVVDFGLAKQRSKVEIDQELSRQGDVIGTFAFMSPEQATGMVHETDASTDVFALGAVALYLLGIYTGSREQRRRNEEEGKDTRESLLQAASSGLQDDLELKQLMMKAVQPDRAERFQSAIEFRDATSLYLGQLERRRNSRARWSLPLRLAAVACLLLAIAVIGYVVNARSNAPAMENEIAEPELTPQELLHEKFGESFASTFDSGGQDPETYRKTFGVGGRRKPNYFITHPEGWPLVGFNFCTSTFNRDGIIKVLQPIFRDSETGELATSEMVGKLNMTCEFHQELARPDYVISGLRARGGVRLHGIKVVYCRETANGLDVDDCYESQWYGGEGTSNPVGTQLGNDGSAVRGVVCAFEVDINKIALLLD